MHWVTKSLARVWCEYAGHRWGVDAVHARETLAIVDHCPRCGTVRWPSRLAAASGTRPLDNCGVDLGR